MEPDPSPASRLRLVALPLTHPDAASLVAQVQQEYVVRYGTPDETPLDPAEFTFGRGEFHVGYLDHEPVATGAWRLRAPLDDVPVGPVAEIKRMYVVPSRRGLGLARRVLAHLETTARLAGAEVLALETGTRQPEAIALYESCGYLPVAGFGHYAADDLARSYARVLAPRAEQAPV